MGTSQSLQRGIITDRQLASDYCPKQNRSGGEGGVNFVHIGARGKGSVGAGDKGGDQLVDISFNQFRVIRLQPIYNHGFEVQYLFKKLVYFRLRDLTTTTVGANVAFRSA